MTYFDLFNMLGSGPRSLKKIGRILPEQNGGIGVSTVLSWDKGYETALLDKTGAHPVQRYRNRVSALKGHKKWLNFAKTADGKSVVQLGVLDKNRKIKLRRCSRKDYVQLKDQIQTAIH